MQSTHAINNIVNVVIMRVKEFKNKTKIIIKITIIIKDRRPVYFTTTWGCHRQTWHGCWNAWRNHPIQNSNPLIHKCGFDKWLKFHVLTLLRRTPLTRLSPAGLPVSKILELWWAAMCTREVISLWVQALHGLIIRDSLSPQTLKSWTHQGHVSSKLNNAIIWYQCFPLSIKCTTKWS